MDEYTARTLGNLYTLHTMLIAALAQALEHKGLLSRQELEAVHQRVVREQLDALHRRTCTLMADQAEVLRWEVLGIDDLWARTDPRTPSEPDRG